MIRWHVFHSWSIIFRNWEYTLFSFPQSWKNSWSHLHSDSITGQKSWWNEGPYVQVGIYKNRLMWRWSNQRYKIINATKSAVFAATDSGPGNATQNLREAICAHQCMSETNKQEKSKAVSEEIKKTGPRLTWIYTCCVSTTLLLTSEVCQKKRNRLTGFLLSINTSAFCR